MRDKCQTEKQLYIYEISAKPKMSAFFARTAHSRDVGTNINTTLNESKTIERKV